MITRRKGRDSNGDEVMRDTSITSSQRTSIASSVSRVSTRRSSAFTLSSTPATSSSIASGQSTPVKDRRSPIFEEESQSTRRSLRGRKVVKESSEDELMVMDSPKVKSCNAPTDLAFFGYDRQLSDLMRRIESTLKKQESNSAIICGPRGSGKTTLLNEAIKRLHVEKLADIHRFDGLLETDVSTLLADMNSDTNKISSLGNFFENLLEKVKTSSKATLVVLDEFDLFCRKQQTFLYNLVDLSQKCTSLCVIGLTTRQDCLELLEKRVKSRMNQNVIYLNHPFKDVEDYVVTAKRMMSVKKSKTSIKVLEEKARNQFDFNQSVRHLQHLVTEASWTSEPTPDPIMVTISSLSHYELLLLVVAFKYCQIRSVSAVPCSSIVREVSKFSGRIRLTRDVVFRLVQNLISSGLLSKASSNSKTSGCLNDWTMLSVNIREEDLGNCIKTLQSSLPTGLQLLVSLN